MTALRLHARVWLTSPIAPAAGGLAALVTAAAILTIAASSYAAIPIVNVLGVMLLVLALGGSAVTALMLPPRPRPAGVRRVASPSKREAPGTRTPAPVVGGRAGVHHSQPATGRLGRRPAAVRPPTLAAAGPTYSIGRATVPLGGCTP